MEILEPVLVPVVATSLFALLGLYVKGQYRSWAMAGRSCALDSGNWAKVRLLMHVTTQDNGACQGCREAHGTTFLPSLAANKHFSTLRHPCSSPRGCRCLIVGLHGGWSAADRLVETLRRHSRNKPIKLGKDEVLKVFERPWRGSHGETTDRVTIQMVQALYLEGTDPEASISQYRYVVQQARSDRDLRLVVPAYIRLVELLRRVGRPQDAVDTIEQFEKRFSVRKPVAYYPKSDQRKEMSLRKALLLGAGEPGQPVLPSLRVHGVAKRATHSFWR